MEKNRKNPTVLLVCNKCGHMWEPNEGSKKPQCSKCRSTSKHYAKPHEIEAYISGAVISPDFTKKADEPGEIPTVENNPDSLKSEVQDIDIEALINRDLEEESDGKEEDQPPEEDKKGCNMTYVIVAALVLIGGALAGWFFLSRWRAKNDVRRAKGDQEVKEHRTGYEGLHRAGYPTI
ncbi:hypothetical protein Mpet_2308 [Methanolacinia petrolearia DSM 11571]|uniref:Uncharacterized protein n=1 Tax=Methanolacinia petrolearia (strain DSM 11571 / OCM 486 / SEBR 4847) TaxID=679926 RepID=E1RD72_METP4|nr:hypothetical protein [Methanolacinia petrolearia]ADN37055.1 hypothetical protein Mpet_2308 [Methanolacinia petrolearia DSM 11571]